MGFILCGFCLMQDVGVMRNERVDRLAGEAVQGDTVFTAPDRPMSRNVGRLAVQLAGGCYG
jgi:hypothetical protein